VSRNSKNARVMAKAREITALHLKGEKGPSRTGSKHGKVKAWWQSGSGTYSAFIKGGKKGRRPEEASDSQ